MQSEQLQDPQARLECVMLRLSAECGGRFPESSVLKSEVKAALIADSLPDIRQALVNLAIKTGAIPKLTAHDIARAVEAVRADQEMPDHATARDAIFINAAIRHRLTAQLADHAAVREYWQMLNNEAKAKAS